MRRASKATLPDPAGSADVVEANGTEVDVVVVPVLEGGKGE